MSGRARQVLPAVAVAVAVSVVGPACTEAAEHGADGGGVAPVDTGTRDAGFDANPGCHWDCFGDHTCEDGRVYTTDSAPVPCELWTGSCPGGWSYTCEKGCRTDGVTWVSGHEDPVTMCEEGRPKVPGDECTTDADCQPPSASGSGATIDRMHLECDEATGTCVSIPDPVPEDWLEPCGADPGDHVDLSDSSRAYGFIEDETCSGGICLFAESDCLRAGCGVACEHDWDCPDGSDCVESHDWTRRDGGAGAYTTVCWPRLSLSCVP